MTIESLPAQEIITNISEGLKNLQLVHRLILNTYFKHDQTEQDWATRALFSKTYTSDTNEIYYAPNASALPYLLDIALQQSATSITDLQLTTCDGKNTRKISEEAGYPNSPIHAAADLAVALNISSLIEFEGDKLKSFGIRVGGDELFRISTKTQNNPDIDTKKLVQTKYPQVSSECGLQMEATSLLTNIEITQDARNAFEVVVALNANGKRTDNKHHNLTISKLERLIRQTRSLRDLESEGEPKHKLADYPLSTQAIILKNPADQVLLNLIEQATFNPLLPKDEKVYAPDPFLEIVRETMAKDENKKYLIVAFGALALKKINKTSTLKGNKLITGADLEFSLKFGNPPRVQIAGSEYALIEDTGENRQMIKSATQTITNGNMLHPENHMDKPATIMTIISEMNNKTNLKNFWKEMVDRNKDKHYFNEIKAVVENCNSEAVWSFITGRFNSRIDSIRSIIHSDENLISRLSIQDLDVLELRSIKKLNIDESVVHIKKLSDIFVKLFQRQTS